MPDSWAECGHRWPGTDGTDHVCIKPPEHVADITDDDHRCCCGVSTWETA